MSSFYEGKKVVVTGGAGLIGSQLVGLLVEAGARVQVIDDRSRGQVAHADVEYCPHDAGTVRPWWPYEQADAVFNLAAFVAGVLYNQSHNLEMFGRNLRLQTAPLQMAERAGVPHFLQVSSVCVYSPEHLAPCREEFGHVGEPSPANAGYSWAKRMGERAAMWSGVPHVVIVRPSNTYGPNDYFDERAHVIPALIRKCLEDDPIIVNGTGNERREFIHAQDVAKGMMIALERGAARRSYNLGTNGETCVSIRELVEMIQKLTGTEYKDVIYSTQHDAGDAARWSDCQRMRELGWEAEIGLEEGIGELVTRYAAQRPELPIATRVLA